MEISMTWLMAFAESVWDETPKNLGVDAERLDRLTDEELQSTELQVDEMWSFVGKKKFKR
jgi:hypothetical protein